MRRIFSLWFTFAAFVSALLLMRSPAEAEEQLTVVALYLVNAETGTDIRRLQPNAVVNLAALPTRKLNVRAVVAGSSVKEVVFSYDQQGRIRTELSAPYALAGDQNGKFRAWTPTIGAHSITVTAKGSRAVSTRVGTKQQSFVGKPLVLPFKVVDVKGTPANTPIEQPQAKATTVPTATPAATPAPTKAPTPAPKLTPKDKATPKLELTPTKDAEAKAVSSEATIHLLPSYRIKAGGRGLVDANGIVWQADTGLSSNASYGERAITKDLLGNALYISGRSSSVGPVKFQVPLPNGEYQVVLHFMELYASTPGKTIFDVVLEGSLAVEKVDIVGEVGFRQPLRLSRTVTVHDGVLDLLLRPVKGVATISGLEVMPARP